MDWTEPRVVELPKVCDPRGNLTFAQSLDQVPFEIKRVYWIYDVPAGEVRGAHAHKGSSSLLVAASGSFTVKLFDGRQTREFPLNRPWQGLYVPPGYWRELVDFSSGSLCMVLTSTLYDEADYERDLDAFIRSKTR